MIVLARSVGRKRRIINSILDHPFRRGLAVTLLRNCVGSRACLGFHVQKKRLTLWKIHGFVRHQRLAVEMRLERNHTFHYTARPCEVFNYAIFCSMRARTVSFCV